MTATTVVSSADTGTVTLYNGSPGCIDVVVDREPNVVDDDGSLFAAQSPSRLVDTRTGLGTGGSTAAVAPHSSFVFQVAGARRCPPAPTARPCP